jgi:hypothetical protein
MTIRFENPPTSASHGKGGSGPKYLTHEIQEQLRSRPNEWALVMERASHIARAAVHNYCRRRPWFQTTVRTVDKEPDGARIFNVYVRYVPNAEVNR